MGFRISSCQFLAVHFCFKLLVVMIKTRIKDKHERLLLFLAEKGSLVDIAVTFVLFHILIRSEVVSRALMF